MNLEHLSVSVEISSLVKLSQSEYQILSAHGQRRDVARDETVFTVGDSGQSMFLIESGGIELSFERGLEAVRLGPRDYFGELSILIGEHRRMATARTTASSVLLEIGREAFRKALRADPDVVGDLLQRSCRYLLRAENALIDHLESRKRELEASVVRLQQTRDDLSQANLRLETDELTGLFNRRYLNDNIEQILD